MALSFIRKHNRYKNFDYSTSGAYYITFCSEGRQPIFSTITKEVLGHISNHRSGELRSPKIAQSSSGELRSPKIAQSSSGELCSPNMEIGNLRYIF